MPPPWLRWNQQDALLWPVTGTDTFGVPTTQSPDVSAAVQLSPRTRSGVRWNVVKREILDPHGQTISLDAEAMVPLEIANGSHMWLGSVEDWVNVGSESSDQLIHVVKRCDVMRDLKGCAVAYKVSLMRLHNQGSN
jgi:hypothetical protein